jgi:ATP-dependent RNA helicase DeaD
LYSKYLDRINVLCVYGGASIDTQIRALRKTQHIIIATPGRLIDLIKRKAIKLEQLHCMVLDEADEMLNMGFKEDLDKILSYTPKDKMTWLFSATMAREIKRIVGEYMEDPFEIQVNSKQEVNKNIEHQYAIVKQSLKGEALRRFMDIEPSMRAVVFTRTKYEAKDLAEDLLGRNYMADALHGDLSQAQRDRVMKRFKDHKLQMLIATDVAARGIDVADLTHVFHHSLPDDDAYYTHRSGRTARAGKKGKSVVFVSSRETHKVRRLTKQLGIEFSELETPTAEMVSTMRISSWCESLLTAESKVKEGLLDQAKGIFENLSKDELIEKLLGLELSKLSLGEDKDFKGRDDRGGGGGRGDRRGGGGDRRRGGGGDRRRSGGGGDRRSGGGGDRRRSGGGDRRSSGDSGGGGDRRGSSGSGPGSRSRRSR